MPVVWWSNTEHNPGKLCHLSFSSDHFGLTDLVPSVPFLTNPLEYSCGLPTSLLGPGHLHKRFARAHLYPLPELNLSSVPELPDRHHTQRNAWDVKPQARFGRQNTRYYCFYIQQWVMVELETRCVRFVSYTVTKTFHFADVAIDRTDYRPWAPPIKR